MGTELLIREATDSDFASVWPFFQAIVSQGDSHVYPPTTTPEQAKFFWRDTWAQAFVAVVGDRVVGTYRLRPNQPGLGDHVANAGFMVDPTYRGQGVGSAMCEHALATARAAGYRAMQFNFVVSTNERAVALWKRHGFVVIGQSPRAFRHSSGNEVDALIMHRFL